jgi:uncharacterized MAPEG superfamily protein
MLSASCLRRCPSCAEACRGNDSRRSLAFKNQTEAYPCRMASVFAPRIVTNRATTVAEMATLQVWRWRGELSKREGTS